MSSSLAHEQAQGLLSDYMEDSLSEAERQSVKAHLESCTTCREELALLKRTMPLIQGMPRVQAPSGFTNRVSLRARKSGILARRRRTHLWRISTPFTSIVTMAVLMAAVGAMLVVVLMLQQQIEVLIQEQPPTRMQVDDAADLERIARLAWAADAEVRVTDKPLAPDSPIGDALELELRLDKNKLEGFFSAMEQAGLQHTLLEIEEYKTGTGSAFILVQRRQ
ncbi:MAG: zf-HC2 domain-containing protein [Deltaproteobacteria bacterium]|nr:zf-HC2 domain-containing protein [Deltaproteobacteria bacterium]